MFENELTNTWREATSSEQLTKNQVLNEFNRCTTRTPLATSANLDIDARQTSLSSAIPFRAFTYLFDLVDECFDERNRNVESSERSPAECQTCSNVFIVSDKMFQIAKLEQMHEESIFLRNDNTEASPYISK